MMVAAALVVPPFAAAEGGSANSNTTSAYLRFAVMRSMEQPHLFRRAVQVVDRYAVRLGQECPRVLAAEPGTLGAPASSTKREISEEVADVIAGVAEHVEFRADIQFAHLVESLHWSSSVLSRLTRALAAQEVSLARLHLPNLCDDLRAWVASGYQTVPTSTTRFLHERSEIARAAALAGGFGGDEFEVQQHISDLLRPYEDDTAQSLARALKRRERGVDRTLAISVLSAIARTVNVLKA
jgi:hypothetical protein